jgi:hypothetical protein
MHLRQTATYLPFTLFRTLNSVTSLCLNIFSLQPLTELGEVPLLHLGYGYFSCQYSR